MTVGSGGVQVERTEDTVIEVVEDAAHFCAAIALAMAEDTAAHGAPRYFAHPAWTELVWTRREAPQASRFVGLVARQGGAIVGWWALVASKRSLGWRLQNIGQEISDYAEPHVAATLEGSARQALTLAFLGAVRRERRRFTFAQFANFFPTSEDGFAGELARLPGNWRLGKPRDDLAIDATPFGGDWETYVRERISRKSRKNMRNEWNVLGRRGEVTIERPADRAALEALRTHYTAWYRYGPAEDPGRAAKLELWWAFFDRVFDDLLEVSVLRVAGVPASLIFGFRRDRDIDLFSMTFDPAFMAESVGKLHLQQVIRAWMEAGGRQFNFLVGDEDYKKHLATTKAETRTLFLHHGAGPLALLRGLSPKGKRPG